MENPGQDIPVGKRAEEELARKNKELFSLNKDLAEKEEELRRKLKELGERERDLRETSQYLENLITYANTPIIVWDPEFRITRFNHAFERLSGRPAGSVIGKPLDILFPDESRTNSMDLIGKTRRGERWEAVEISIRHVNGEVRTVLWNSANLYGPDGHTVVSTIAQGQDITDRKRAEEELRRTGESMEFAQNSSGAGMWDWDFRSERLTWSPGLYRIFGLDPATTPASWETWQNILHPEDATAVNKRIQDAIRDHTSLSSESRIILPGGEIRWINALGSAKYDESGKPLRMWGICIDITSQKNVEAELRQSEERYRSLFETMTEGFVLCEIIYDQEKKPVDFTVLNVNPAFGVHTGLDVKNVIGHTFGELSPLMARNWAERLDYVARTEKPLHFEEYVEPIGRWMDTTVFPADQDRFAIVFSDITPRKKAMEALRESEEHYRLLHDTMVQGVVYQDAEGKYISMNPAAEWILGKKPSEFLDRTPVDEEYHTVREDGSRFPGLEHPAMMALSTGRELRNVVMGVYNPRQKGYRWINIQSAMPLFRPREQRPYQVYMLFEDITDQKKAEETLKNYAESLRRSNKELEQFAYVASHDLREPLRMVTVFSQLLERNYKDRLDPDANEFIHYIVEGGSRMGALIDDLLEFSRVTSRAKPFRETDLNAVLTETLSNLAVQIQETDASISVAPLPVVWADRPQMVQVFQNLVNNSLKYRGPDPPQIEVSVAGEDEKEWTISVRDNGIGIDPEYHEQIFEIFKRLHSRGNYPGTGIGLSLARKIVERHGGSIWVESEEGRGATFFFTMPKGGPGIFAGMEPMPVPEKTRGIPEQERGKLYQI